ncbi:MAG: MBL fold metallo-hydrolase [Ruminococcaceae bacterium]|nr:MBL fold metallo-hydrolase [Oscillospiraceae bacterium]
MRRIRLFSLYSGSTGNAFLLDTESVCILIDGGKSAKALCQAIQQCNRSPDDINAIFVTHEHSDHVKALPVFLKKHPVPVHLPAACAYKLSTEPSALPHLCPHPPIHTETVGDVRVTSFPTPHDSRGSVGYRFEIPTEAGVFAVGYATDMGYVTEGVEQGLMGCHAVVLESNHDPDMLWSGPYPYDLKARVASMRGHLSNGDCAALAARLAENGTKSILLAHLSQENNTPDIAFDECYCSLANEKIRLQVASPDLVTELKLEERTLC